MEALYTWMTEQGLDPATFPYIAGALLVVLLLVVLRLSRRQSGPGVDQDKIDQDRLDQQAAEAAVQAEANRLAEEKAEAERQAAEQEAARKVAEEAAQRAQEEADAERLASEQAAARKAAEEEAERVAAEQAAAAERQAREEAEQRIKGAEEQARLKAEQAEAERQATAAVDAARQAAEAEAARVAAETEATEAEEKAAAVEREAQEEIDRARAAAEQAAAEEAARQQAEADERERLAKEEEERLAREEAARLAAEQAAAAAEAERLAREEAERQAAEDAARQLAEAEAARKAAEAEAARKAAEEEAERIAAEKAAAEEAERQAAAAEENKGGFFARIKSGLSRTKANLTEQLGDLFLGAKEIDEDLLEEIETTLLMADVGVEATTEIIEHLTDRVERKQLKDADALKEALQQELAALLGTVEHKLQLPEKKPAVILMVGVNGVGKTTTIGKLAKKFQSEGKSVMLAAGDTFRAAAVEQLQVWGERNNVPVVAQHTGADSASVIFDALQSAQSKGVDVLIADTAGRLQNKDNLMQELQKVVRVMQKLDPDAPHEVMLVLDAGTGQNAISQAKQFKESVGVSGITLTKLDGTAKGGIIFAIAKQFDLPIRFIGVGEQVDDLRPFEAEEFVKALFD
jgi:fused signal recognition particle receptor